MKCAHDQYRSVLTSYDRDRGTLVYFATAATAAGLLWAEYERVHYRPLYETSSGTELGLGAEVR